MSTTQPAATEADVAESALAPIAADAGGVITLDTPIKRGTTEIATLTLRKPTAGELRGVQLGQLLQLDVNALRIVLPRVTLPTLTQPEVDALDPADLVKLGTEVASFLLPKADRTRLSQIE